MIQAGSVVGGSAMSRVLGQALQEDGGAAGESVLFSLGYKVSAGLIRPYVDDSVIHGRFGYTWTIRPYMDDSAVHRRICGFWKRRVEVLGNVRDESSRVEE